MKSTSDLTEIEAIRARNEERRKRLEPVNATGIYVTYDQYWNGAVKDTERLLSIIDELRTQLSLAEDDDARR